MRTQYQHPIITGVINGSGVALTGSDYTVTKFSTGLYIIKFYGAFRLIGATACAVQASAAEAAQIAIGDNHTLNITTLSPAGAAVDGAFSFVAVGA